MDNRIVIPRSFHKRILQNLHSAHQGLNEVCTQAQHTVYWPGMNNCLRNYQQTYQTCIELAPSQFKELIEMSATPEWPFQQVQTDNFHYKGQDYLIIVYRFSSWPCIYYFKASTMNTMKLINMYGDLFTSYGVSEEFN